MKMEVTDHGAESESSMASSIHCYLGRLYMHPSFPLSFPTLLALTSLPCESIQWTEIHILSAQKTCGGYIRALVDLWVFDPSLVFDHEA